MFASEVGDVSKPHSELHNQLPASSRPPRRPPASFYTLQTQQPLSAVSFDPLCPTTATTLGSGSTESPQLARTKIFTACSGEQVRFQKVDGAWQAELVSAPNAYTIKRTLPVVSSSAIGPQVLWLHSQAISTARARIHILNMPQPPYHRCAYLGKAGLLGGTPSDDEEDRKPEAKTRPSSATSDTDTAERSYGVYISHSGHDKLRIAEPLYHELKRLGLRPFLDKYEILEGEHGPTIMERAMESARCAVFILSPEFVATEWPIKELNCFLRRYKAAPLAGHTLPILLPIFYRLRWEECRLDAKEFFAKHFNVFSHAQCDFIQREKANKTSIEQVMESLKQLKPFNGIVREASEGDIQVLEKTVKTLNKMWTKRGFVRSSDGYYDIFRFAVLKEHSSATSVHSFPTSSEGAFWEGEGFSAATPNSPSLQEPENTITSVDVQGLLLKKLAEPQHTLRDQDSIAILTHCVAEGERNAKKTKGQDALMVIGNTGAGKSTFLNYLMGCQLQLKDPALQGLPGLKDIVVVSPDSPVEEVMPIGHAKISKTFIPQIEVDRADTKLAYCDCPGFLDNRGAEINIANAVNIRRTLQTAQRVKVLILINYYSLEADRSRGLRETLSICRQLFGTLENLRSHLESVLLGITQAPLTLRLPQLRSFLTQDEPPIMEKLAQRVFLYDPLDRGGEDFWNRGKCRAEVAQLKSISQGESCELFKTVLTDSDERKLLEIVDQQGKQMVKSLQSGAYSEAGKIWRSMDHLRVIDHVSVERMLHGSFLRMQQLVWRRIGSFRENCSHYRFSEAESQLRALRLVASRFREADLLLLELDIAELMRHLSYFQRKKQEEDDRLRRMRALSNQVEEQKRLMEERLRSQRADFSKEQSRLFSEMERRDANHDDQLKKIREEYAALSYKQEEEASLLKTLSAEGHKRQEEEQERFRHEYEARLQEAQKEQHSIRAQYEAMLESKAAEQARKEAVLQAKLQSLVQRQTQKVVQRNRVCQTLLPAMAFGAQAWKEHFDVDVGEEPVLPADINTILNGESPFLLEDEDVRMRVAANHLLTLIPANVDGAPFTLDKLGSLILRYFPANNMEALGQNSHGYRFYSKYLTSENRSETICSSSYWLLLPKTILADSRSKTYASQKEMVDSSASYRLPHALEVATSLLSHYIRSKERCYADANSKGWWTYTRCSDVDEDGCPLSVGGFESSGLYVNCNSYDNTFDGVVGCRQL